jgi:hypothetical protein
MICSSPPLRARKARPTPPLASLRGRAAQAPRDVIVRRRRQAAAGLGEEEGGLRHGRGNNGIRASWYQPMQGKILLAFRNCLMV